MLTKCEQRILNLKLTVIGHTKLALFHNFYLNVASSNKNYTQMSCQSSFHIYVWTEVYIIIKSFLKQNFMTGLSKFSLIEKM